MIAWTALERVSRISRAHRSRINGNSRGVCRSHALVDFCVRDFTSVRSSGQGLAVKLFPLALGVFRRGPTGTAGKARRASEEIRE